MQGRKGLFLAMAGHFANDSYSNLVPVLLPFLLARFDLTLGLGALLVSTLSVSSNFLQLAFGRYGHRLQRLNMMAIGPFFTGFFLSIAGAMPNVYLLFVAFLLAGIGSAMFHPQASAFVAGLSAKRSGLYVSSFITAGSLGFATGPLLMAGFIQGFGFGRVYFAAIPIAAISFAMFLFTRPPRQARKSEGFRAVFRQLRILWAIVIFRRLVFNSLIAFMIVLLATRGLSFLDSSITLFLFLVSGAVGSVVAGHLSDMLGRRSILITTLALAFVPLFIFLNTRGLVSLAALMAAGFLNNASNSVTVAKAYDLVTPEQKTAAGSIVMGFAWGVAGVGLAGVGFASDVIGLDSTFEIISFAMLLSSALAFRLPK